MLDCMVIQWILTYPATTGPDHGQISEVVGYVNNHANCVKNVPSLAKYGVIFSSCHAIYQWCVCKQSLYLGLFGLCTVKVDRSQHLYVIALQMI